MKNLDVNNTQGKEEVFEEGLVITSKDGYAEIDVTAGGDCEACNARAFCSPTEKSRLLKVVDPIGVEPGNKVKIKIGGSTLLKASSVLYGAPLILLVGGILFGMGIFENSELKEVYAFLFGSLLTALYYIFVFMYGKIFNQDKVMPVISSVIKNENIVQGGSCSI